MLEKTLEQILLAVSCGLLAFFAQLWIYRTVYKRQTWRSHLFEIVLKKVRLWVYLTMVFLSLKVITYLMPPTIMDTKPGDIALTYVLMALGGILAIEAFSALFYDFVLADRKHLEIPTLYRDITRFVLYLILVFIVVKVAGYDVSALITGGTVITVVIGFATQESLGNLFAGIFLHGSRPFVRGDWVRFNDKEGMVDKIDWRATTIRTNNGDYIIFPNALIAKMEIINYSAPTKLHAVLQYVGVAYQHPPSKIKRILIDCAIKTNKVQAQPAPVARLKKYDDSSITYELKFWITDFEDHPNIQANVLEKIWYHFKREDVEIPFPIRTVQIYRPEKVDAESTNYKLLKRIDFLSEFPEADMKYLTSRLKVLTWILFHDFAEGVLVETEQLRLVERDHGSRAWLAGQQRDLAEELARPELLGEEQLPFGVAGLDFHPALADDVERTAGFPLLDDGLTRSVKADELISTVLARRQEYSAEKKAAKNTQVATEETDGTSSTRALFVRKIRDFFSY